MNSESIFEILQKELPKYSPIIPKRDTKDNVLLDVLCTVINKLITNGDKTKNDRREFYPPNRKPPTIGIDAYLARLLKYSPCSKECFVMSLVYIDRFLKQCDLIVNSMNIHRLVITSLLISTKYLDDIFYNNEFYSQVGGISLKEMNGLEVCFLSMMDYTVNCSLDEFELYSKEVDKAKSKMELQQQQQQANIVPSITSQPPQQPTTTVPNTTATTSTNVASNNSTSSSTTSSVANTTSSANTNNSNINNSSSSNSNNNIKSTSSSSSSSSSTLKTNNTSIPMRRRGSCDYTTSMQTNKDKAFAPSTGWVA